PGRGHACADVRGYRMEPRRTPSLRLPGLGDEDARGSSSLQEGVRSVYLQRGLYALERPVVLGVDLRPVEAARGQDAPDARGHLRIAADVRDGAPQREVQALAHSRDHALDAPDAPRPARVLRRGRTRDRRNVAERARAIGREVFEEEAVRELLHVAHAVD